MIKFYFPRTISSISHLYDQNSIKNSLFMLAEEDSKVLAVCQFMYHGEEGRIQSITDVQGDTSMTIFDGLFRAVMFHMMEMECKSITITNIPVIMEKYLSILGFEKNESGWQHDDFGALLFSGCSSCGENQ